MKTIHPVSWLALAAAAAVATPGGAVPLSKTATVTPDTKPAQFSVYLPLRNTAALGRLLTAQQRPGSPEYHQWLTPADFAARFGPTAGSMNRVQAALKASGLQILDVHSRSVTVSGTTGQVNKMFGTRLHTVTDVSGRQRLAAQGRMAMPTALQKEGAKVIGLANLPEHKPMATMHLNTAADPDNRQSLTGTYWFTDLKQAYDYPSYQAHLPGGKRLDGTGTSAAVLMSDLIYPGDVPAAFHHENFTPIGGSPSPIVTTYTVDGGGAYNGNGSFEASLDVQQITGGAPGAKVALISIPDLNDGSIIDGYTTIVESNQFDVVNSSFGLCELYYNANYNGGTDYTYIMDIYHDIFAQGSSQGITFVASSGDDGAPMCLPISYFNGQGGAYVNGVSSPANDPLVTAVGGGNLITTTGPGLNSAYVRESAYADLDGPQDPYHVGVPATGGVWAAGGGISDYFARPTYQTLVNTGSATFRTVPDVGMQVGGLGFSYNGAQCQAPAVTCSVDDSSVRTAFAVGLGGGFYRTIGTSVSSPEFVGALLLYIQKTGGRVGNINTYLYTQGAAQTSHGGVTAPVAYQYYHRNIPGFDGSYPDTTPSQNYNYINGNGTPDVRKLFGLTAYPAAGVPQTASNP